MKLSRYAIYAWSVLIYSLAAIGWGAYVRATGSGAGCGAHWPQCNGQFIPRAPQIETIVEFSHRLSTGLAGLLVIGLVVWAFRVLPKGHAARTGAALSLFFIILEGAVGALQVKLGLVADNPSLARALVGTIHLVNTFLMLAAMTLTAWWASGAQPLQLRRQGALGLMLGGGLALALLLGASGAVTALGDTLFPAASLAEGIRQDFLPTAHFLIRLRIWHPVLAVLVGIYAVLAGIVASSRRPSRGTYLFAQLIGGLFFAQLLIGALNVYLLAPVWMQLLHLLMADLIWIALVLLAASALAQPAPHEAPVGVPRPAIPS